MNNQAGFTLLELMITLAIISLLLMMALPKYQQYLRRARYTELVQAAAPYQLGVAECFTETTDLKQCQSGLQGIPAPITEPIQHIQSLVVQNGVITITPVAKDGFSASDTYVLTPEIQQSQLTWQTSGGGIKKGYAR